MSVLKVPQLSAHPCRHSTGRPLSGPQALPVISPHGTRTHTSETGRNTRQRKAAWSQVEEKLATAEHARPTPIHYLFAPLPSTSREQDKCRRRSNNLRPLTRSTTWWPMTHRTVRQSQRDASLPPFYTRQRKGTGHVRVRVISPLSCDCQATQARQEQTVYIGEWSFLNVWRKHKLLCDKILNPFLFGLALFVSERLIVIHRII